MNFKKISAVLGTVLMTGLTLGSAAAANYPAPFIESGSADVAIVYGSAPADDMDAAGDIKDSLSEMLGGAQNVDGTATPLWDSDYLTFGAAMNSVIDDLGDSDMVGDALADGEYDNGDVDNVDYEQTITLGTTASALYMEDDLNSADETIAYYFEDGDTVFTYTLDLDGVNVTDMPESDFPLFGQDYYVLEAAIDEITLLNSAEKVVITEGETKTIAGKEVSARITSTDVQLTIDGELLSPMEEGESDELDDGSYVIINENYYDEDEVDEALISIGSGTVVLEDGEDLQISDGEGGLDDVDGLAISITGASQEITQIQIVWTVTEDTYLTEGDSIIMPEFEKFALQFDGMEFGDESELITFGTGTQLTLEMENFNVEVLYNSSDQSDQWLGNDGGNLTLDSTPATTKTYYLGTGDMFLATYLSEKVGEVEQIYYEVGSLDNDTTTVEFELNDLIGSNDVDEGNNGDLADVFDEVSGDFDIDVLAVYNADEAINVSHNASVAPGYLANATHALEDFIVLTVTHDGETMHFDKVVSETGMVIELPTAAGEGEDFVFYEADEDGDIETSLGGESFNVTIGWSEDEDLYVTMDNGIPEVADPDSDLEVGYDVSTHATRFEEDTDAHTLEIEYYVDEVYAKLNLVDVTGVEVTSDALGSVLITDANAATSSANNLIVVGGSCINSAAAALLGGAHCGAAFTEATAEITEGEGVGAGEFLIAGFENSAVGNKFALLVAGYEKEDTADAALYLANQAEDDDLDTSGVYTGTNQNSVDTIVG